jgi:hypothetical protein
MIAQSKDVKVFMLFPVMVGLLTGTFIGLLNYFAHKYGGEREKVAAKLGMGVVSLMVTLNFCKDYLMYPYDSTEIMEFYAIFAICVAFPIVMSFARVRGLHSGES